jgi:hypothetical protein
MAEIVDLPNFRKMLRARFATEMVDNDTNPEADVETDRLLASLNALLAESPLAEEEKIVALYTRLIQSLAEIEDENERRRYVDKMRDLLRWEVVEAAVQAFKAISR